MEQISSDKSFADHRIPSFAQPGERRSRGVPQPSRSVSQIDDGRAVGAPQMFDHKRQLAAISQGGAILALLPRHSRP